MKVRSVLHQCVSNSFLTLIDCTKPLGMENGQIRDDQITASKAYVAATIGHATGD